MGAAPNRRSLRLWAALQSAQGGARKACGRSPKPTQLPPLGLISRKGNIRSWNHRRAMAGDSGRDVVLDRNRTGETAGVSPGLSGKAEAAGPVHRSFVSPFPEAKGVRSGDSDSGPQAEGDRPRSPERNRRRNGAGPKRGL